LREIAMLWSEKIGEFLEVGTLYYVHLLQQIFTERITS